MAVRFDAAADRLARTSGVLSMNADYTVMGWVYLTGDTNNYQTFYGASDDSTSNFDTCGTTSDGVTFMVGRTNGGVGTFVENAATALSLNTWYHWAVVRSGNNLTGYLNGTQTVQITSSISGRAANTRSEIGGATSANLSRLDGRLAYVKSWAAALTEAQIKNEMHLSRPVTQTGLYGWWPLLAGSGERVRDYSGNGRDFTEGGTLTDEAPPPVSWGGASRLFPYVLPEITGSANITLGTLTSSAAGAVDIVGAGSTTLGALTASAAGTVETSGAAAITLGALTVSSDGTVETHGEAAITLGALTSNADGAVDIVGAGSITLGALTASASGGVEIVGSAAISLGALTSNAAGSVEIVGSASITLGALTLSAEGVVSDGVTGELNVTLGALTASADGTVETHGEVAITLGALTVGGAGTVETTGAAGITLGGLTLSSAGAVAIAGTSAITLGALTLSASGTVNDGEDMGTAGGGSVSIQSAGGGAVAVMSAGGGVLVVTSAGGGVIEVEP